MYLIESLPGPSSLIAFPPLSYITSRVKKSLFLFLSSRCRTALFSFKLISCIFPLSPHSVYNNHFKEGWSRCRIAFVSFPFNIIHFLSSVSCPFLSLFPFHFIISISKMEGRFHCRIALLSFPFNFIHLFSFSLSFSLSQSIRLSVDDVINHFFFILSFFLSVSFLLFSLSLSFSFGHLPLDSSFSFFLLSFCTYLSTLIKKKQKME